MAASWGKIRTTSMRCLISPFRRPIGFVECSFARCCRAKVMQAKASSLVPSMSPVGQGEATPEQSDRQPDRSRAVWVKPCGKASAPPGISAAGQMAAEMHEQTILPAHVLLSSKLEIMHLPASVNEWSDRAPDGITSQDAAALRCCHPVLSRHQGPVRSGSAPDDRDGGEPDRAGRPELAGAGLLDAVLRAEDCHDPDSRLALRRPSPIFWSTARA